ncbi:MAG TPA: PASTA domain-containing protein [Solirubrobacteraceae bacterium]|nr:PASTA domain-containing protein [Solirubrobacteraceae bacterium]
MPGFRIAAILTALVALAMAPAAAQATGTQSSQITGWTSSEAGTPANDPYLISYDNAGTTLTVTGTAVGMTSVDVVCYYGASPTEARLAASVAVHDGTFNTGAQLLKPIAGHACRLRAIPAGTESSAESNSFAGPGLAISEAALPLTTPSGSGVNQNTPYNFYLNDVTFSGFAAWSAVGTPPKSLNPFIACGGPEIAPINSSFDVGNFAIDCAGSLLSDDLGAFGGRSEIQIDGHNAYDPASALSLFTAAGSSPASENIAGFPKSLATTVQWDPATGLMSSQTSEPLVECNWPVNVEVPTFAVCPSFVDSGVKLERDVTTSDGGRVVTVSDTLSSTDGKVHTVDLLYDNAIGVSGDADGDRGYEFPGQTGFSQYATGNTVPGPSSAPGTILVRTNVTAPDGDPNEAAGAITFGTAPSGFAFTSNGDFEEHNVVVVPAGGSARLSHIYSVGYSVADVTAMASAAQDRFNAPSVVIGSPADGMTTSSPTVTLSGITSAGSGVASLVVGGQKVSVAPDGSWTAPVALSPGTNTITAVVTDGAGATAQAQVAVVYIPPSPSPPPPPAVKCRVPRLKGKKLATAERALRQARCRVGKIKRVKSKAVRKGRVTSASPSAGHTFPSGHKIELFVSKGR